MNSRKVVIKKIIGINKTKINVFLQNFILPLFNQ